MNAEGPFWVGGEWNSASVNFTSVDLVKVSAVLVIDTLS